MLRSGEYNQSADKNENADIISSNLSSIHNNTSDVSTGNDVLTILLQNEMKSVKNLGGKKARAFSKKHGLGSANQQKNRKILKNIQQGQSPLSPVFNYMDIGMECAEQVYKGVSNLKKEKNYSHSALATEGMFRLGEFAINTMISGGICNFIVKGIVQGAVLAEAPVAIPLLLSIVVTNSIRNYVITPCWEQMETSLKEFLQKQFSDIGESIPDVASLSHPQSSMIPQIAMQLPSGAMMQINFFDELSASQFLSVSKNINFFVTLDTSQQLQISTEYAAKYSENSQLNMEAGLLLNNKGEFTPFNKNQLTFPINDSGINGVVRLNLSTQGIELESGITGNISRNNTSLGLSTKLLFGSGGLALGVTGALTMSETAITGTILGSGAGFAGSLAIVTTSPVLTLVGGAALAGGVLYIFGKEIRDATKTRLFPFLDNDQLACKDLAWQVRCMRKHPLVPENRMKLLQLVEKCRPHCIDDQGRALLHVLEYSLKNNKSIDLRKLYEKNDFNDLCRSYKDDYINCVNGINNCIDKGNLLLARKLCNQAKMQFVQEDTFQRIDSKLQDHDSLLKQGLWFLQSNNPEKAINWLDQAIETSTVSVADCLTFAIHQAQLGQNKQAQATLENSLYHYHQVLHLNPEVMKDILVLWTRLELNQEIEQQKFDLLIKNTNEMNKDEYRLALVIQINTEFENKKAYFQEILETTANDLSLENREGVQASLSYQITQLEKNQSTFINHQREVFRDNEFLFIKSLELSVSLNDYHQASELIHELVNKKYLDSSIQISTEMLASIQRTLFIIGSHQPEFIVSSIKILKQLSSSSGLSDHDRANCHLELAKLYGISEGHENRVNRYHNQAKYRNRIIKHLEAGFKLDSGNKDIAICLANKQCENMDYRSAKQTLQKAMDKFPETRELEAWKSIIEIKQQRMYAFATFVASKGFQSLFKYIKNQNVSDGMKPILNRLITLTSFAEAAIRYHLDQKIRETGKSIGTGQNNNKYQSNLALIDDARKILSSVASILQGLQFLMKEVDSSPDGVLMNIANNSIEFASHAVNLSDATLTGLTAYCKIQEFRNSGKSFFSLDINNQIDLGIASLSVLSSGATLINQYAFNRWRAEGKAPENMLGMMAEDTVNILASDTTKFILLAGQFHQEIFEISNYMIPGVAETIYVKSVAAAKAGYAFVVSLGVLGKALAAATGGLAIIGIVYYYQYPHWYYNKIDNLNVNIDKYFRSRRDFHVMKSIPKSFENYKDQYVLRDQILYYINQKADPVTFTVKDPDTFMEVFRQPNKNLIKNFSRYKENSESFSLTSNELYSLEMHLGDYDGSKNKEFEAIKSAIKEILDVYPGDKKTLYLKDCAELIQKFGNQSDMNKLSQCISIIDKYPNEIYPKIIYINTAIQSLGENSENLSEYERKEMALQADQYINDILKRNDYINKAVRDYYNGDPYTYSEIEA